MYKIKKMCPEFRIVAISATIPNASDIGKWIGGRTLIFDSSYRPVPLITKVLGYMPSKNQFTFENSLNFKLPDIIKNYSD